MDIFKKYEYIFMYIGEFKAKLSEQPHIGGGGVVLFFKAKLSEQSLAF